MHALWERSAARKLQSASNVWKELYLPPLAAPRATSALATRTLWLVLVYVTAAFGSTTVHFKARASRVPKAPCALLMAPPPRSSSELTKTSGALAQWQ